MNAGPCLSILVWTEDGADTAYQTVKALALKMLTLVDPHCDRRWVEIEPLNDAAALALKGAAWKGARGRDRQKVVDLRRAIAGKLVERAGGVPGFVLFHVDGDTRWEQRDRSETPAKFAEFAGAVEQLVAPRLEAQGRGAELPGLMRHLRVLMPFHSIEAWLFQNTTELARLCRASCGRHLTLIQRWAADRGLLDELAGDDQPKAQMSCIETRDHVTLASNAYPADPAFAANKSYAAAVMSLLECDALGAALARTYTVPS